MSEASDRLTSLTPEQEDQIPRVRDEWLAIGLSTEPADREMAERSIDLAYRAAGLEPPTLKIWLDSPLAGAIGASLLSSLPTLSDQLGNQPGDQAWGQVCNQIYNRIGDQVWSQVRDQVKWQVYDRVLDQFLDQIEVQILRQVQNEIRHQVERQVHGQVHGQVRDQIKGHLRKQVGQQVSNRIWSQIWVQIGQIEGEGGRKIYRCGRCGYGSLDAHWVSQYAYFRDVCGVTGIEQLRGIMGLTRSCGLWWPFTGAVILTERPSAFHQDEQHRLHCEDGPAISYPDGFGVWAIHGVRVPRQVVEAPETLTAEQIRGEKNAEVQRVMLERFGTERWIRETSARLVHRDDFGTVWRTEAIDQVQGPDATWVAAPYYAVQVVNGTPEPDGSFREFFLRVDAWCRPMRLVNGTYVFGEPQEMTGLNAVASTYGLTGEVYASGLVLRT